MDKHITISGQWNVYLFLLVLFFLSACGEENNPADMATKVPRTSAELIEPDNAENAPVPQLTLDNNDPAPEMPDQNDDAPSDTPVHDFSESAWGAAELIAADKTRDVFWPQVTLDNNGNALVVWVQKEGARTNIQATRFNGSGWGTAELIETDHEGDSLWPQIALDNRGNALAVWAQSDGARTNIRANRFNGSDWGNAKLIETDNKGDALWPQIALDNRGNALAVWAQNDGVHTNIWANRFNGSDWGTAELLETDNAGSALWPQIRFDDTGNALAVWIQSDGSRTSVWANRFNGSQWGTAELLESDNAGDVLWPQVAFDRRGNALAVWAQNDGTRYHIWANRFNGTDWGTAELIETDNAEDAFKPQIAFDNNGNALALWGQYDGARTNIWANRFNGTDWGTAELIETDDAGNAFGPQLAFDDTGSAFVVWVQNDGARYNIRANRFDGSNWGTAELIETDDRGDAFKPQIALDNNGNALAVWKQYNGVRENIRANHFR